MSVITENITENMSAQSPQKQLGTLGVQNLAAQIDHIFSSHEKEKHHLALTEKKSTRRHPTKEGA
jgi:hypothetical protein